jgi:hypothetical protein
MVAASIWRDATCCCRFIQPEMATTRKCKGVQVMEEKISAGQGLGKGGGGCRLTDPSP